MASGGAGASSGAARQVSADLVSLSQAAKHRLPPVTQAAERALLTLRSLQRSGEPLRSKDFLTPFLLAMREPAADTSILLHAMGAVHRQVTLDTVQAKSVPELLQAIREQVSVPSAYSSQQGSQGSLTSRDCAGEPRRPVHPAESAAGAAPSFRTLRVPCGRQVYPRLC